MSESSSSKTTLFAVRTTIGREKVVQDMIFSRLRTINPLPDIKSILTTDLYRGYVFVEAIHQNDVVRLVTGVPHVKGKVVGSIPLASLEAAISTESSQARLEEGDIVEIISGPFQGNKAQIIDISKEGTTDKVKIRLMDSNSSITVDIYVDYLKIIEKARKIAKEYVLTEKQAEIGEENKEAKKIKRKKKERKKPKEKLAEIGEEGLKTEAISSETEMPMDVETQQPTKIILTEGDTDSDLDAKFSFDNLDEEEEEVEIVDDSEVADMEDEEEEDEDDWAKFFQ
ncbi:MAG: transcription elongation factor Spt5 [Promethearchaeota archaeon]